MEVKVIEQLEDILERSAAEEAFLDHCIDYRVASTKWEREAAFRLLYQAYRRAGLAGPNEHGYRITPYQILPTTNIFVARYGCNVISTVSLVEDGRLGLPLEEIYGTEVAARRRQGVYLAEVSSLADRRRDFHRYLPVFIRLCRLMVQFAKNQRIDQLLVAVHPRHARFYQRCLAFGRIGDARSYPSVRFQPAVALCLDLNQIEVQRPAHYDKFFGVELSDAALLPHPMPVTEQRYFSRFISSNLTRCDNLSVPASQEEEGQKSA